MAADCKLLQGGAPLSVMGRLPRVLLALGITVLFGLGLVVETRSFAQQSNQDTRRSLIDPQSPKGAIVPPPSQALKEQKPSRDKLANRKGTRKKSHKLIRTPSEASSAMLSNQSPPGGAPEAAQSTVSSNKKDSTGPASSTVGSTFAGAGMSPIVPSASATTAGSIQASPAAAATAAPGLSKANAGSRSMQNLMQQVPGLSQLVTGVPTTIIPARPQEVIAPPAPPLTSPSPGLPAVPPNWFAYHVLNRLTYGGTPNQLNTISHLNATQAQDWTVRFMKEQLELDPTKPWPTNLHSTSPLPAPVRLDDSYIDYVLSQDKADWRADENDPSVLAPELAQLQDHDLIRKTQSRRQLLEKMVYFWDNHFNTDYRSHARGQYELFENEAFRARAFGKFIDLLLASGKSPAMMVYLNTDVNVKENPNENYAREVLELHTLGVDDQGRPAGYTQADIVDAAKAFTGWDTPSGVAPGFRFVPNRHSSGSKQVLGQTISFDGGGPGEGEQVLRLAANHPSTARRLAKKLCEYFVSEIPSSALLTEVTSVFTDSGGDIKKVLIAIFTSTDFNNPANFRGLVKTPLEFVVGMYRNLGVWSSRDPFRTRLTRIGQGLYEMPPPVGYKENSEEWLNTHALFNEVSMAYEATIPGFGSTIRFGSDTSAGSTRVWLRDLGLKTEDDVLGFLLNLTTDRQVTSTEYQVYLSTLRSSGGAFNIDNTATETPLDRTLATILANPRYLYQ